MFLRKRLGDKGLTLVASVLLGLVTGLAAGGLKWVIARVSEMLTGSMSAMGVNYRLLWIPVVGILATGVITRYLFRRNLAHGVEHLKAKLRRGDYMMRPQAMFSRFVASAVTLGFGGSAGSEGPIASTGAAIGSNLGRGMGLSGRGLMIMVGCGAGAGIAGIFKSPIGGALFTLEVLGMVLTTVSVLALLICCIVSALTAYVVSGCTLDVPFSPGVPFDNSLWGVVVLLGVATGLYSRFYRGVMRCNGAFLTGVRNVWVRNLVAGVMLGVGVFLFPSLYGEGYGVARGLLAGDAGSIVSCGLFAGEALDGWGVAVVAAGILAVKGFVTSATNSGGGVAGDFAPTLFAGAVVGWLFAHVYNLLFAGAAVPEGYFALFAMAGVMAGAIGAPLMAVFLVMEMTGSYYLLLPICITAAVSYGVSRV